MFVFEQVWDTSTKPTRRNRTRTKPLNSRRCPRRRRPDRRVLIGRPTSTTSCHIQRSFHTIRLRTSTPSRFYNPPYTRATLVSIVEYSCYPEVFFPRHLPIIGSELKTFRFSPTGYITAYIFRRWSVFHRIRSNPTVAVPVRALDWQVVPRVYFMDGRWLGI